MNREALKNCKAAGYLTDEIKALKPKLIIAVGVNAKESLGIKGGLKKVLIPKQAKDKQPLTRDVNGFTTKVAVVPHPSSVSPFWTSPPLKTGEVLEMVKSEFLRATD